MENYYITLPIEISEELKNAKINIPVTVLVKEKNEKGRILGSARIKGEDKNIIADLHIIHYDFYKKLEGLFNYRITGTIMETSNKKITGFKIEKMMIILK